MESVTARDLLETRLANCWKPIPNVDYVWLWEDEQMNWDSRQDGPAVLGDSVPAGARFPAAPRPEEAPGAGRMGRSGAALRRISTRALPGDIIFYLPERLARLGPGARGFRQARRPRALAHSLAGRRSRPCGCPSFTSIAFKRDLNRAAQFGCQGLLGHPLAAPHCGSDRGLPGALQLGRRTLRRRTTIAPTRARRQPESRAARLGEMSRRTPIATGNCSRTLTAEK